MSDNMAMMPPMDMGAQPQMNDMGMGGMPQGQESEFDTNFDAGVEANEDEDPKKYIQQLTGKLSQSLRKYNSDLGQPDVDLNKYVAGMITKQAVEGLSEDDAEEIINKIKSDEPMEEPQGNEQMPPQEPQGDMPPQQQEPQQPIANESKVKKGNLIQDVIEELLSPGLEDEKKEIPQNVDKKSTYSQSVYKSPKW